MSFPAIGLQKRIKRKKLHEEVAEELTRLIVQGDLATGQNLPAEREIMEMYGVGRTSVREALLAMQKSGIIAIRNGERAKVIQPSSEFLVGELAAAARMMLARPDGVKHFQSARMLFEVGIARTVAATATDEDLARLEAALAENREAIGDRTRFEITDMAFHSALVHCVRNPILSACDYALREWLYEQRSFSGAAGAPYEDAYQGHAKVMAAMAARDAIGAEAAMEEHLRFVERFYWRYRDGLQSTSD